MPIGIFINLLIIAVAGYVIYNNLKTMSSENFECGSCSTKQKIPED